MMPETKKISSATTPSEVALMVESIVGCKWSLVVLQLLREGVNRPGAMERSVPGLTAKVLNERLRKMVRFGICEKEVFPVAPPHVEYQLTEFGKKFITLLQGIDHLQSELDNSRK